MKKLELVTLNTDNKIQTPSFVDKHQEIIFLPQRSSNLLNVREISLSLRDLQGHTCPSFAQVCLMGQGTTIMRHSHAPGSGVTMPYERTVV